MLALIDRTSAHAAARVAGRLRAKYLAVLALRDAHVRREDPPDVRRRLRALAAAYPGALRELDQLPREEIVLRLASLERVLGGAPVEPWMLATDRVHRWLRVALRRPASLRRHAMNGRIVPVVEARVAAELGLALPDFLALLGRPQPSLPHVSPPRASPPA